MTLRSLVSVAVVVAAALSCKSVSPDALPAAEAWLALIDSGDYAASWTESASVFRAATDSPGWAKMGGAVRGPLGKVLSRKVATSVATSSMPGGPDGEYVVIAFATSFEHKASAVETVTPMKDTDGKWRVAGYYIR